MKPNLGRWFGKQCGFGFHADLHLWDDDLNAGERALPDELEESLRLLKPDWIQVDSKGHAGYISWFSKIPTSTVAPHLQHDAVAAWREAGRRLGIPVVCHYSGFIDLVAAQKHPEWLAVFPPGQFRKEPLGFIEAWMCPRSDYFDQLMIPQLCELVGDYDVDGLWVDGDIWGARGCYCPKCQAAFRETTGLGNVPASPEDEHWDAWWNFNRDSYLHIFEKYAAAVRSRKPSALICVNWLDSCHYPVSGRCTSDWLSGDASAFWNLDDIRCETRWLSNRRKPWDLMSWPHLGGPEFHLKTRDMLCQEAASVIAAGGHYLFCETAGGIRSSQQVPWRMRRLAEIGTFVRERQNFCQDNEAYPEVVVLQSETIPKPGLMAILPRSEAANNATNCLLECHYSVDQLDEWALLPRLDDFTVVVVPGMDRLAESTVAKLKKYVEDGGHLLVTGVDAMKRFGTEFFGITDMQVETVSPSAGARWNFVEVKDAVPLYFLPQDDRVFPLGSPKWGLLKTAPEAQRFGELYSSYIPEESATGYPAAVIVRHGKGFAAALPADFFAGIKRHYFFPEARRFMGQLMKVLYPQREIEVDAPTVIDVMFRQKDNALQIHLINRSTGVATTPERRVIDEIPVIGGISLTIKRMTKPAQVVLQPEGRELSYEWVPAENIGGVMRIKDLEVRIHSAVIITD